VSIVDEYRKKHPGSVRLHERALALFTANGATHGSRIFDPFRPYITHAKGSKKWDVDGTEYIDFIVSHGALLLGHSHPEVVKAVQEQMAKGVQYGESHELEIEWGELIKSIIPSAERVEFVACGNEADMMILRLGRVFTMEAFNPGRPMEQRIHHTGTWNANPLTAAAGVAACRLYQTGEHQKRAAEAAGYLRKGANRVLKEKGIGGCFYGRNIIHFYLGPADFESADGTLPPTKDADKLMQRQNIPVLNRLTLHLLQRGVACLRSNLWIMSSAHTKEDVDHAIEALADSFDAMVTEGTLKPTS